MKGFIILPLLVFSLVVSAEELEPEAAPDKLLEPVTEVITEKPIVKILSFKKQQNIDGSYKFEYESEDGTKRFEEGFYKDSESSEDGKAQVVEGFYSYVDPNGEVVNIQYVADENGFRPQGNVIHPAISSYLQLLDLEAQKVAVPSVPEDAPEAPVEPAPAEEGPPS